MLITPAQIRAARALLRLEDRELAERAHVPVATLRELESLEGFSTVAPTVVGQLREALEGAGVEFIENGVRTRDPDEGDARILAIRERVRRSVLQRAFEAGRIASPDEDVFHGPPRSPEEVEARMRIIRDIVERAASRPATNPDFSEADLYGDDGLPA